MGGTNSDSFVISATAEAILTKASLASMLQLYAEDRKSTSLTVKHGKASGSIHLREGVLIHAETGGQTGEDAFLRMAEWEKPEVIIVDRLSSSVQSVAQSLQGLLLEAARRRDENHRYEPTSAPQFDIPAPKPTLKSLLHSLSTLPDCKGLVVFDYNTNKVLLNPVEIKSVGVLVDFYLAMIKVSKKIALIRKAERRLELTLTVGTEQHLLVFPSMSRGICVAHIGSPQPDTKALVATLQQVAEHFVSQG